MRVRNLYLYTLVACMMMWMISFSYSYLLSLSAQNAVSPENTIIISNETHESFCKDFSIILKRVHPLWIVLDTPALPESVREKNLIIIGTLEGEYTGDIIRELLTEEEEEHIQDGCYALYEKESPWAERVIYICTGTDNILAKKAAEEALSLLEGEWIDPPFTSAPRKEADEYLSQIQYIPDDEEVPMEALAIDIGSDPPDYITRDQAIEDVEYLFYLLSHGYCGYGYFMTRGDFDEAYTRIEEDLESSSTWSQEDLSQILHDNLRFIQDCHLRIGEHTYGTHMDFWYDIAFEMEKEKGIYRFFLQEREYQVVSINGEDPEAFMFPSLNAQGSPVYRMGVLSTTVPEPLELIAQHDDELLYQDVTLSCSDFTYFSEDIFQETTIGGVPVVRIRSFSDHHREGIDRFLEAAYTYRGEPVLIIDLRGNGGGNEAWPKEWITRFTGSRPSNNRYFTELTTKTTMMGRANYFHYLLDLYPETLFYQGEKNRYTTQAEFFEHNQMTPYWSGPFTQEAQTISNDTTVIVVTNGSVASAAEGCIIYLQQVENVILVGENTCGALVFGQMTLHQLPHSKLSLYLPISLNIPLDLTLREEKGFFPDLWIPGEHAVNYAIAAVRKGTISTVLPLSEDVLQQQFIPESFWKNQIKEFSVPLFLLSVSGVLIALVNRKKDTKIFFIFSICCIGGGLFTLYRGVPMCYVFFLLAAVFGIISGYKWMKKRTGQRQ